MGSRHWRIDGTPEFDRACAAAERAQALAEQTYAAGSKLSYAQIAQSFDLWTDHVDPLGTMTRDEFDAMPFADRIALIETIFGPEQ